MIEKLDTAKLTAVQWYAAVAQELWECALSFDNLPMDTFAAVFSDSNPYVQFHASAMRKYWEGLEALRTHGYFGLEIESGKARPTIHRKKDAKRA